MGPIFLRDRVSYRYQGHENGANGFDYAGRRQNRLRQLVGVVLLFTALIATACIPPPTSSGTSIGKDCKGVLNLVPGAELFGCDLSGLDLAGLDLSGANLKFANLTDANLSGSNLTGANLSGANLTRANLSGADLTNAILAGAILLGATFLYAILFNTSFNYGPVPGGSGSGSGSGGNNGGSTTCTGPYCAGYNEATVDTGDTLCSEDLGAQTGGEIEVYLSPEQLEQRGERSVVTDSDTSFRGAYFGFESDDESVNFFRGLSFEKADFTDATFSNFVIACRDITGARFSGVTFDDSGFNTLAHVTFRNSDFSRSTIRLLDMVEASFEGSKISDAAWSRVLAIVFEEIEAFNENVGLQMADFSNVDFRNSELGLASDPSNGSFLGIDVGGFRRGDNPPVLRYTTWANADLRGATITDLSAEGNIFTGVATDGLTVKGNGTVAGAIFDTGWLGVDWTGTYDFTGATCPDGSVGDTTNPCF